MHISRAWLSAALLAGCVGCRERPSGPPASGAVPVEVARVARRELADAIEVSGTLVPPPGADVKLGALVSGRIAEVWVSEGDPVREGQLLVRIESTALRDAVSQAQAALAQARAQEANAALKLSRAEEAFKAGIAARQEVDDARSAEVVAGSAVKAGGAALSTAKNQLARSELKAPFDGLVAHVFAAAGEPVEGNGKPIIEVADTHALELRAGLAPLQAARVRSGMAAEMLFEGLEPPRFEGKVIAVSPVIDPGTGVATVRIRFENREGALKSGALARARIILSLHPGVLAVPWLALVPLNQGESAPAARAPVSGARGFAVERIDAQSRARRQPVELGAVDPHFAEVRSGLNEGDVVIVEGAYALPDGSLVAPQPRAPPADGGSP